MCDVPQEWVDKGRLAAFAALELLHPTEAETLARAVLAAVDDDIRRAVAEEIAQRIEANRERISQEEAARIAREVGDSNRAAIERGRVQSRRIDDAVAESERTSARAGRVLAERDALAATVERVRWLAEAPDPDATDIYLHYAVQIDGAVHLAVLVDDLRAALDGRQPT